MTDFQKQLDAVAAAEKALADAEADVLARFAAAKKARQANPQDAATTEKYRAVQAEVAQMRAVQRKNIQGVGGVVGGDAVKTGE